MDIILTSSEHSKGVFEQTIYTIEDNKTKQKQELKLTTPVEVVFEGVDLTKYQGKDVTSVNIPIPESFCYLVVGHWMKGDFGHDRKNIGYTIKAFLETFKNKSKPPALLLKTHQVYVCLLYTSPSPRDGLLSRMPSSA